MSRPLVSRVLAGVFVLGSFGVVFASPHVQERTEPATETVTGSNPARATTAGIVSYNPGLMSPDAAAAMKDRDNQGKGIGMVRGNDRKLHLDRIYERGETITPSPAATGSP